MAKKLLEQDADLNQEMLSLITERLDLPAGFHSPFNIENLINMLRLRHITYTESEFSAALNELIRQNNIAIKVVMPRPDESMQYQIFIEKVIHPVY